MPNLDLKAAFDMEPKDAVAYFRSRGYQITDDWHDMWQGAHARAFTVAKASSMDVLETIRGELDTALASGMTPRDFAKNLQPLLEKKGWWGKKVLEDGREVQLGSAYRLNTIFRVNTQTAYMAGRYRRQLSGVETRPYWMYVAILDGNTRPEHRALNGKVFRWDDPIWQYLYPPNGWGCRCRVRALTEQQVRRMGVTVEKGDDYIKTFEREIVSQSTGEVKTVEHMRVDLPDGGSMSPDIGWAYNPGVAAYGTDQAIAKKIGSIKSSELRSQLIQTLNNAPERQRQFAIWAQDVLEKRRPGHGVQTVGFMPERLAQLLTARLGVESARLMVVNEKQLVHSDSDKHRKMGTALSHEQLVSIPTMLATPEAVLIETQGGKDILFVYPGNGKKVKIVLRLDHDLKKQQQKLDAVINVFTVSKEDLLKTGMYEVIDGELGER
jgi:SPP1 gp7 family putative phage head morphogenesis protein